MALAEALCRAPTPAPLHSTPAMPLPCSNPACAAVAAFTCSRCHAADYCGVSCQRALWRAHKPGCAPPLPALAPPRARGGGAAPTRMALAGGAGCTTLLSSVHLRLLPYFDTREACALRLVCREMRSAVAAHQWQDRETVIMGSIGGWRACFPRARCANVRMDVWDDNAVAPHSRCGRGLCALCGAVGAQHGGLQGPRTLRLCTCGASACWT